MRMRLSNGGWLVSGVALAGALAVAQQWRIAQGLRQRVAAQPAQADELARLRAENERLRALQVPDAELARLRAEREALPRLRAEIAALKKARANDRPSSAPVAGRSATAGGPQARPMTAELRAKVEERYAELLAQLALDRMRTERMKRLLEDRMRAGFAAPLRAMEGDRDPNAMHVRQEVAEAQARAEAMIRAQLGAAVHAAYEEFEWTLSARSLADQFERLLATGATPLGEKQKARLVGILARARPPAGAPRAFGAVRYRIRITDETVRLAGDVLSAPQLKVFEAFAKSLAAAAGP